MLVGAAASSGSPREVVDDVPGFFLLVIFFLVVSNSLVDDCFESLSVLSLIATSSSSLEFISPKICWNFRKLKTLRAAAVLDAVY